MQFHSRDHRRQPRRLHPNHPNLRPRLFDSACNPSNQAAAADRHHNRLQLRNLFQQLQPNRALSRHHHRIVEGMNKRHPLGLAQPCRLLTGLVVVRAIQQHLCAEATRRRHLHQWSSQRHHDQRPNPSLRRVIRNPLRMIACTRRHHPASRLL